MFLPTIFSLKLLLNGQEKVGRQKKKEKYFWENAKIVLQGSIIPYSVQLILVMLEMS